MQMQSIVLKVEGMTCGHCSRAVKEMAEEVEGVNEAQVNLESGQVTVTVSDPATAQSIIDNINNSNIYKAQLS